MRNKIVQYISTNGASEEKKVVFNSIVICILDKNLKLDYIEEKLTKVFGHCDFDLFCYDESCEAHFGSNKFCVINSKGDAYVILDGLRRKLERTFKCDVEFKLEVNSEYIGV